MVILVCHVFICIPGIYVWIFNGITSIRTPMYHSFLHCNHKTLGPYYIYTSIGLGVTGTLYSMLLRLELYGSGNRIISPENQYFYSLSYTLHGILMIFYMVMPGMIGGLGNYMIPIYMGASEVGFPRANGYSLILLFPVSISYILVAGVTEFPGGTGWTLYPPLSISLTVPLQVYTTIKALVASGVSSLPASMNFYSTLTSMRYTGTGLGTIYLFPWAIFIVFILLILMLPVLTGTIGTLVSDTCFNTVYMDPAYGGDPVLYQHLFWFFGHPEVYILIVPAFGVQSHILLGTVGNIIVYGGSSMVLAMSCISSVGSLVWGHHIYTIGIESDTRAYYTGLTVMISLPTGTKLMNWISTATGGVLGVYITARCLFMVYILGMFTTGGSTGIVLGNAAMDVALHDTYYVIAHFHFILSLGAMVSTIVGVLYSQEILSAGPPLYTSIIYIYYYIQISIGITMTFTPMHLLGFNYQTRRITCTIDGYNSWNSLSSLGSGITILSMYILPSLDTQSPMLVSVYYYIYI